MAAVLAAVAVAVMAQTVTAGMRRHTYMPLPVAGTTPITLPAAAGAMELVEMDYKMAVSAPAVAVAPATRVSAPAATVALAFALSNTLLTMTRLNIT